MNVNDIVTVRNPTSEFLYPGMPGLLWSLPDGTDTEVCVAVTKDKETDRKEFLWTSLDNVVLIAKHDATWFNPTNVDPQRIDEVVRLLQIHMKKAACHEFARTFDLTRRHGHCFDRWGRKWTFDYLSSRAFKEAAKRGGDFVTDFTASMHAMCMSYKFSDVDPTAKPEPTIHPTKSQYVNVYNDDRAYGGPEEGGWWYDSTCCIESHKVSRKAARLVLKAKQRECDYMNEGAPPISSVLSRGMYYAKIENRPGTNFPGYRPTYS